MIDIAILRAMVAAGAPVESILAAIEADQRAEGVRVQARRLKDAQRQSARREAGAVISAELRISVYERDDWRCVYCNSEERLTCDHVIPVIKGGPTTFENLVTACLTCNSRKQDRDRKHFERILERERKSKEVQGSPRKSEVVQNGDAPLTSSLSSSTTSENIEETKGSKKVRASAPRKTKLPDDWAPNEAHFEKAKQRGLSFAYVNQKADDMRNWAKGKGILRADWDATFHGFIRPRETTGTNGHAAVKTGTPWQNRKDAGHSALDDLRETVRRLKSEPEGGGDGGGFDVQLVPATRRA